MFEAAHEANPRSIKAYYNKGVVLKNDSNCGFDNAQPIEFDPVSLETRGYGPPIQGARMRSGLQATQR